MSGHYRMYRGAMDHPVFGAEPFTRYQAFEWMIAEAAWKDRQITVGFAGVELKRGQLCKSVRILASEWKWEQTKVVRFIRRLEAEKMITTDTATGVQRVTICNYDKYQACGEDTATATQQDRNTDATPAQQTRNSSATTIEELKEFSESVSKETAVVVDQFPPRTDEQKYFDAVVMLLGNKGRSLGAKLLKQNGGDLQRAASTMQTAAAKHDPREWICRVLQGEREESREEVLAETRAYYKRIGVI